MRSAGSSCWLCLCTCCHFEQGEIQNWKPQSRPAPRVDAWSVVLPIVLDAIVPTLQMVPVPPSVQPTYLELC
ncbi:hypothetical protein LX32DRAFT_634174 [Colletotrichum zoysiae]|uniref:Uncharacterized protein n=1 Tax=Colletotrichum zoysiae TaxID=1216348 RepID=A0AAD9HUQ5_9PEZI|nr:hypothetical protein LX32DRAFT_634174 [Colletotrichum zoysiae]